MKTLKQIQKTVDAADAWRWKGDWTRFCRTEVQVPIGLLAIAVRRPDPDEGLRFMQAEGVKHHLERCLDGHEKLLREISEGRLSSSSIGGNYLFLAFAHLSILVADENAAKHWLSIANSDVVRSLSPAFWARYGRAFWGLLNEERTGEVVPSENWGAEQRWAPYLELILALSADEGASSFIESVETAFAKRNRDKRFRGDSYEIEGSGHNPAKWDYRLRSLEVLMDR